MIDLTGSFYSEAKRKDLLREAEQYNRTKTLRTQAPTPRQQRIVVDLPRPARLWKQLLAAILGH